MASLKFVNWSLRDEAPFSWLVALLCPLAGWIVWRVTSQWLWGSLSAALLVVAFWRVWLPIGYELDGRGVTRSILGIRRRISWREFARYRKMGSRVVLLVDPQPGPLDAFRGLYLHSRGRDEELIELLDRCILRPEAHPDSTVTQRDSRELRP